MKKLAFEEYPAWLNAEHGVDNIELHRAHYNSVAERMKNTFGQLPFWTAFSQGKLKDFDEEYRLRNANYPLFATPEPPELFTKRFDSFLHKTYRINILQNSNWPKPPKWLRQHGWVLPSNWFDRMNDIVRTCFVVKYFDGVKFLEEKWQGECRRSSLQYHTAFQALDEGHYAAHFYVYYDCDVPSIWGSQEVVSATAELQITTQVQEVIRAMLHKHYESRRKLSARSGDWKWDQKSSEFATNYLGHILHYLEGVIVEVRDRQKEQP